MSNDKKPPSKARFINPPNRLKQKVGSGGVPKNQIEAAQDIADKVDLDFLPVAEGFIREAREYLENSDQNKLINTIMQLKANGAMFHYRLISDVADLALQFLESIEDMDNDANEVIDAHIDTIKIILNNNLRGDGGAEGYELVKELDRACRRYFEKHKQNG